jgi:hypothetical protein
MSKCGAFIRSISVENCTLCEFIDLLDEKVLSFCPCNVEAFGGIERTDSIVLRLETFVRELHYCMQRPSLPCGPNLSYALSYL